MRQFTLLATFIAILSISHIANATDNSSQVPSGSDARKANKRERDEKRRKQREEEGKQVQLKEHQEDESFKTLHGKTIPDLIPSGWKIKNLNGKQAFAKGDLNKDGIEDLILVLERCSPESDSDAPCLTNLMVFLGQKDGVYNFFRNSRRVIYDRSQGGQYDPLESITVTDRVLVIKHFGSYGPIGFERWEEVTRFRFQNQDLYLIGKTRREFLAVPSNEDPQESSKDINFSTGKIIEKPKKGPKVETVDKKLKPVRISELADS